MIADRTERHGRDVGDQHRGPSDRKLADVAGTQTAAHDDAFGLGPDLELEKAADDFGQLLSEFLDRRVHDTRGQRVFAGQDLVELGLGNLPRRGVAQRILVALLLELGAATIEDLAEGPAARAIADEALGLAQFLVVAVDRDGSQRACSV
jgi:hypothetical protein